MVSVHLSRQGRRAGARLTQVFPKKMGSIFQTCSFAASAPRPRRSHPAAGLAPVFRRMANVLRKPVSPCTSRSKTECLSSADPRSCYDTSRGWRRATRTNLRSTSWRCRSPMVSRLPALGSGKASLIFQKRMAKNSTRSRRKRIEFGFAYSLSYSVSDLKILEDHGSQVVKTLPP